MFKSGTVNEWPVGVTSERRAPWRKLTNQLIDTLRETKLNVQTRQLLLRTD